MQRQTAVDALIDAGRDVATAVGAERDRPATTGAADPAGSIAASALLLLAVWAAPILVVALVGYLVALARDADPPGLGVGNWVAIGTAGTRGTMVIVGATLPLGAALGGAGLLDVESGSIALGSAPGPILGVAVVALGVVTWHAAVVGIAVVTAGRKQSVVQGLRFGRSAVGVRLSAALAGVVGGTATVGFGLTAIPAVGPVAAAVCGGVGIAIAGRLMERAVTRSALRGGVGNGSGSGNRSAVPADSAAGSRRGSVAGETGRPDGRAGTGPVRSTATRRPSRRGRP